MELMRSVEAELRLFNPIEAGLEELRAEIKNLKVLSEEDLEGYKEIKSFRTQKVTKIKSAIEEKRKELKKFYLDAGRAIDGRAKEITLQLQSMIDYCRQNEAIVDDAVARRKAEEEAVKKARVDEFIQKLFAIEVQPNMLFLDNCSDDDFNEFYLAEKAKFDERKAEEVRLAKIEEEKRLAQEKEEQLRREALAKQEAELEQERQRLAKIREEEELKLAKEREALRQKELEIQRQEAERQAKIAEEERQKRLEEQKKLEAEQEKVRLEEERKAQEEQARIEREALLAKEAKDKKLLEDIKLKYPTLEEAWLAIFKLIKG